MDGKKLVILEMQAAWNLSNATVQAIAVVHLPCWLNWVVEQPGVRMISFCSAAIELHVLLPCEST